MTFSIDDLPNATGYETSAYDFGRSLPSFGALGPYGVYGPDFLEDGLWLPIEGVWAGNSYGCGQLDTILNETNEAAALDISDAAGVEHREYHAGYWWLQVMTAGGEVIDCAREVLDEIALALVNYPLLDEDAFSEREWDETAENLDDAVKDELREAPIDEWDAWDEACEAAGVDLLGEIIRHEDFEYESEDCWPRFYNCNILEIAAAVVAAL
jgi:hypothetical protein